MKTLRCAIYLRVSTSEQNTDRQRADLMAVASFKGWDVVHVFEDAGVSGSKGRDKRPGLDAALTKAAKHAYDVLLVLAVDRLGRSLSSLVDTLQTLQDAKVDLCIHNSGVDTTTPSGRALFGMLSVFAELERSLITERIVSGIANARKKGVTFGAPKIGQAKDAGKAREDQAKIAAARTHLESGIGIVRAAKMAGLGTSTVQKLKNSLNV